MVFIVQQCHRMHPDSTTLCSRGTAGMAFIQGARQMRTVHTTTLPVTLCVREEYRFRCKN